MAYTVSHLYDKFTEGLDKMGSDLFGVSYMMNKLEAATYDFIGESVKYMENTQEIRDDIRTLYKPFSIAITSLLDVDVDNPPLGLALPSDYHHLMSFKVINTDASLIVRDTRMIRHGQLEIYLTDPDKKPDAEHPLIVLYQDTIRVYSTVDLKLLEGMYVKKPTFWVFDEQEDIETEIAVDLPDHSVDKIIKDIINETLIAIGDPRAQIQYQTKEQYRKRGANIQ